MRYLLLTALVLFVMSCDKQPKIDYQKKVDTVSRVDDRIKDTTKVMVAALPGKFDSTDVLIFPIGYVDLNERKSHGKIGYGSSSSYSSSSGMISGYYSGDDLSGSFTNILFEGTDGTQRKLTDKKITISNIEFLRPIYKKVKSAYLLYTVYDRDTNADGQLEHPDLSALYLSKIDGSDFKKVTKELHLLYDQRLIGDLSRLYFRTQEDVNKDGELDKQDKFHYYKIDFSSSGYQVSEFDPLKLFK